MASVEIRGSDTATVAAADIARLANVGRAAVSNWRRRFADFPRPVGGSSASPLYSLNEVIAWLNRHGKRFELTPADQVWQRIRGTADDLQLGELIGYVGAFLVMLHRDAERWQSLADMPDEVISTDLPELIHRVVPELADLAGDQLDAAQVGIARLVAEVGSRHGLRELFDFLRDRYLEVHSRRYSPTPPQSADLMIALADVAGGSVLDPACGIGTLLLSAAAAGATGLNGQDTDRGVARLAAVRLLLRDLDARIAAGDSLRHDAFEGDVADAVVCNPPFGERSWGYDELVSDPRWEYGLPPRGEPELAWLQHCLAHVKPGGRVVIMMPPGAAARRAGRRIRSNLLRSGALRAIMRLPPVGGAAAGAPDLWVLERPDSVHQTHVLMVDASADPLLAESAWRAFLTDPTAYPPGPSRSMRIIDLLDEDVDISPLRHLPANGEGADSIRFQPARTKMVSATKALVATLPDLAVPVVPESLPMTTVNELVRAGALVIRQAPIKMATDSGDTPVLTAKDVRRGREPSGIAIPEPGSIALEPGDVVTLIACREAMVRVISAGGALLGPQLLLFRADPTRIDPHFLAGFLRIAQARSASRDPSGSSRVDLRRASIPRLPLEQQRDFGAAFQQLMDFEEQLRQATALGEQLVALGFSGLADGSLRPRAAGK